MALLFNDFAPGEKSVGVDVKVNGDYDAIPEGLSCPFQDILNLKPVTLVTFVDIGDGTGRPEQAMIKELHGILQTLGSDSIAFVVILGKLGTTVGNPISDYDAFMLNLSATGFETWDAVPFLLCTNDAWAGSMGQMLAAGLNDPVATPICYLITKTGNNQFKIQEKMHMECDDTGNGEYGPTSANPTIVANDIFAFREADAGGTLSFPDYPTLAAFFERRLSDHAGAGTNPPQASAALTIPGTILDLGTKIDVAFTEKAIGADTPGNYQYEVDPMPKAAVGDGNVGLAARQQLVLESAVDSRPGYLSHGEHAKLAPTDNFLLANAGSSLSIHLTDNQSTPPQSLIATCDNAHVDGPVPATPFLIGSFTIGTPESFIRAHAGDHGVHADPLYVSPDIAISHDSAMSADQLRTGLMDPNFEEPATDISTNNLTNKPNRLFVRVFRKGSLKAQNLKAQMYYATPTTLPTPNTWKPVCNTGTAPHEFFAAPTDLPVEAGESLAVSQEFSWSGQLPQYFDDSLGDNTYCLVCVMGCDGDHLHDDGTPLGRLPTLSEIAGQITNWDQYYVFVRQKNVAWKNVVAVHYETGTGGWSGSGLIDAGWIRRRIRPIWFDTRHLRIPFHFPIPPFPEPGWFEITNRLPRNVRIDLAVTERLVKGLRAGSREEAWELRKETAILKQPLPLLTRLPRLALPVKDPQFMQLDVTLPENVHGGVFPLTVRQLHKGHEIGRLTYLIELPKTLKGEGSAGKRSFKA